jgi:hypothetical protein
MAGSAAPSPVSESARAERSHTWWRTRARRQRCAARRTRCSTPPPTMPDGCCSLRRPLPASWPGLGPADLDPNFQFGRWLVTVWARPVGPDGCGPVTATGNRDNKEIRSMSGPMSERAPDITVEADGRAESTTVLSPHRDVAVGTSCPGPPVRVELRLAPVLHPLLEQRPHLACHLRQKARSRETARRLGAHRPSAQRLQAAARTDASHEWECHWQAGMVETCLQPWLGKAVT